MTAGSRKISVVDSHTCGQSTRVIVGGIPEIEYGTVAEARDVLRGGYDWVRLLAVFEPHGHRSLFAAALIPASDPTAVQGVVFMDAAGYHDILVDGIRIARPVAESSSFSACRSPWPQARNASSLSSSNRISRIVSRSERRCQAR